MLINSGARPAPIGVRVRRRGRECHARLPASVAPSRRCFPFRRDKYAERGKKPGDGVLVRKVVAPDRSREVTVDREIVSLKHVADYTGGDDSVPGRGIHLIAPLIAVRGMGHNFEPR